MQSKGRTAENREAVISHEDVHDRAICKLLFITPLPPTSTTNGQRLVWQRDSGFGQDVA